MSNIGSDRCRHLPLVAHSALLPGFFNVFSSGAPITAGETPPLQHTLSSDTSSLSQAATTRSEPRAATSPYSPLGPRYCEVASTVRRLVTSCATVDFRFVFAYVFVWIAGRVNSMRRTQDLISFMSAPDLRSLRHHVAGCSGRYDLASGTAHRLRAKRRQWSR